ncbi:MAG: oxaloacetate decarboxylase gamma subunit [Arenicella sp.]|jgi:oxaloacetate decarboxylase gamma subunit
MQDSLIDQGLNLMLFGMGTVFVFLTILVFATTLMSTLVNRFSAEVESGSETSQARLSAIKPHAVSPQIVSAIEKAIAAHRQR